MTIPREASASKNIDKGIEYQGDIPFHFLAIFMLRGCPLFCVVFILGLSPFLRRKCNQNLAGNKFHRPKFGKELTSV